MSNYYTYGVNVKVYDLPPKVEGQEILSEEELYSAWDMATETFWFNLSEHTKEHYGKDCWSEGRMGGWAVFDTGNYEPPEEWVETVNNMVLWAKNEVYPNYVKDMIEDKRYESHMIVVLPDGETFDIVDDSLKFGYVKTDKLDKLDYSLQIDNKIQSGDVYFVLDGQDVKSLSRIKAR
jgi:hypothetical protein